MPSERGHLIEQLKARNRALDLHVALVERENRQLLRYKQVMCELAGSIASLVDWNPDDTMRSALERFRQRLADARRAPHAADAGSDDRH